MLIFYTLKNNWSTFTLTKILGFVPAVALWLPQPTATRAREADHRGAHGGGGQHRQDQGGGAGAPRLLLLRPDAGGATLHGPLHHHPAALHQGPAGAGGGGGGEELSTLSYHNAEPGRKKTASQVWRRQYQNVYLTLT
jgi:hypothetical protein